jgi:pyruvate,water dikinase
MYVKTFGEMTKEDIQEAGGKAANLGELTQNGFNVPPGFCVTSESLFYHIGQSGLQPQIDQIVAGLDYEDYGGIEEKTSQIRDLITKAEIPQDLFQEIREAIEELNTPEASFVAVRSSVAVKDSPISSFPGMMDTYHYLKGEDRKSHHVTSSQGCRPQPGTHCPNRTKNGSLGGRRRIVYGQPNYQQPG